MVKKLLSGYDMALALKHYKNGDLLSARGHLDRYFKRNSKEDPVAVAFDATILVLEKKSEQAAKRFAECRALAKAMDGRDAKYLEEYCLYYECLITDGSDCTSHRSAALGAQSSSKVSRWLKLPEGDF